MTVLLGSCDFVYHARIQNDSNEIIEVTVSYNKRKYDSVYKEVNYYQMVPSFENNRHLVLKKYDSVKLQITYEVPPKAIMQIQHSITGWDGRPDFYYIDEIHIHTRFMEQTIPKTELESSFKKMKSYEYVLTIR